jgi:hypothetical protein
MLAAMRPLLRRPATQWRMVVPTLLLLHQAMVQQELSRRVQQPQGARLRQARRARQRTRMRRRSRRQPSITPLPATTPLHTKLMLPIMPPPTLTVPPPLLIMEPWALMLATAMGMVVTQVGAAPFLFPALGPFH